MLLRALTLVVVPALLFGCGGGERKVATVPVKGTLYVDDKPFGPALMQLTIDPPDAKIPVVNGYVKPDGSFELKTYTDGDGAPPGKYKVVLMMDPMAPGNLPTVQPATVEVAKSSGSAPAQLDVKLQSSGTETA